MEIPNLSQAEIKNTNNGLNAALVAIIVVIALTSGFWLSRIIPLHGSSTASNSSGQSSSSNVIPADNLNKNEIQVGKTYGDTAKEFKDTAVGVIEKGNINGEGTHILNRDGGVSQRASLTSSVVDLDLFIGRKVEVKGETNTSTKTAWLLDVGSVKVLQ